MGHAPDTCRKNVVWNPTDVGERVCAFLRRLYPTRTIDNVAADVEGWHVSRFTVAKMFERQTAPGAILWCALIDAYGPNFLAAALPKQMGWIDDAARAQRKAELEARMAALRNELERL